MVVGDGGSRSGKDLTVVTDTLGPSMIMSKYGFAVTTSNTPGPVKVRTVIETH